MGETFAAVLAFLEAEELTYELGDEGQTFTLGINGRNGSWICSGFVSDDETQFVFRSHLPVDAPTEKFRDVAELLVRANYLLTMGAFSMDYSDGEIVYRSSAVARDSSLPLEVVAAVIGLNIVMADHFLPAITAVVFESVEPETALRALDDDSFETNGGDPVDATD